MAQVEQKTMDYLFEKNRFERMLEFKKLRQSQRLLGKSTCFICPIYIVLRTKLLSHDLNAAFNYRHVMQIQC